MDKQFAAANRRIEELDEMKESSLFPDLVDEEIEEVIKNVGLRAGDYETLTTIGMERWKREVRDPAKENSEGSRVFKTKKCIAEYEIAQIPVGWAITMSMQFKIGDMAGIGTCWSWFESRTAALEHFIQTGKRHFKASEFHSEAQAKEGQLMLKNFEVSMFDFVEPDVVKEKP